MSEYELVIDFDFTEYDEQEHAWYEEVVEDESEGYWT